jgi:phenylacetate-CoA ligase
VLDSCYSLLASGQVGDDLPLEARSPAPRRAPELNRSDVTEVVWPPIPVGEAAVLGALLRQLDDSQWMPSAVIEAMQHRQLALLLGHCARHSPYVARILKRAELKPSQFAKPGMLRRLPALTRRQLQDSKDVFCSMAPIAHMPIAESPTTGSTGTPVMALRTAISSLTQSAFILRAYGWHGRRYNGRACTIRVSFSSVERRDDWGAPASKLFPTGPALNIPTTTDLDTQIDLIAEFRPDVLSLSPSNLLALARRSVERRSSLGPIRHFFTMAETVSDELRQEVEETLGGRIVDIYSSQELGCIAVQCPDSDHYHVMAEGMIVEVVDEKGRPCAEGETGRLVITDLLNFATPLIRYEIGDWAETAPPCPCGRGLPTLKRIVGRERNMVRLPDGRRFWPRLGNAHYRRIAPVVQVQSVQETLEQFEMRLVVERPLTETEEAGLRSHLQTMLGWPVAVRLTYFDGALPPAPGGKMEDFISLVA